MNEWQCPNCGKETGQSANSELCWECETRLAGPVVISGGYISSDLTDKIAALESRISRLKALCGEGLRIIKDLGNNNIFSHKAVADLEQRLKDEGVVK